MNIDISGKVVVITGASKGIGAALALAFAKEQAYVVMNYYHSEKEAIELFNKIRKENKNCLLVKGDITNPKDVSNLYKNTIDRFGKVDVLINNAGICDDNLVQMMTLKQWNRVIETNLTGTFLCSREFSKAMIHQKYGKIINIASLKGQEGCVGQANYSASKAGVIALTKTLAKELGKYNIAVNAVCPGFIVTDLNKDNPTKRCIAQKYSLLLIDSLLFELIHYTVYMVSDSFNNISGRIFNIDSRIV
mgnify:CR=1 FL=1